MRTHRILSLAAPLVLLTLALAACHPTTAVPNRDRLSVFSPANLAEGERLKVVVTTSIVADVVQNVGGDRIQLTMLVPLGADPHAFEPTPQNMASVVDAHVIFASGAGLEAFLESLMTGAEAGGRILPVSTGVALLPFGDEEGHAEAGAEDTHDGADPHTWFDPGNVIVWVRNIRDALSALDPANAATYEANAAAYTEKLQSLDAWIRAQVEQIPPANRKLVTDHTVFAYFAARYEFEQVGAVFPGASTLASPSARELADLQNAIRAQGVKAVFVGKTVNPALSQRVAQDTGASLVFVYTGSLGEPGSPGSTYLDMMRYNVTEIVGALR